MALRFIDIRTPKQIRDDLCEDIAAKHGVPLETFYGQGRGRPFCRARWEAWDRLSEMGYSTTKIGQIFDGRDHSTVSIALRKLRASRSLAQQEAAPA